MGNNIFQIIQKTDADRLFNIRLCVDLAENIHLHYRDLRIEFSFAEWETFAQSIIEFFNFVKQCVNEGYKEGSNDFHKSKEISLSDPSTYYGNKVIKIEKVVDERYHIHYHDIRIELNKEMLDDLVIVLGKIMR